MSTTPERPDVEDALKFCETHRGMVSVGVAEDLCRWILHLESTLAAERAETKELRELLKQSVQDEYSSMHPRHYRMRREAQIASLQPATDAKENAT